LARRSKAQAVTLYRIPNGSSADLTTERIFETLAPKQTKFIALPNWTLDTSGDAIHGMAQDATVGHKVNYDIDGFKTT